MLFKNLNIYRLNKEVELDFEALETALNTKRARLCGTQEPSHDGFAPAYGKDEDGLLVHVVNNDCALIRVRNDSLLLPESVVKKVVDAKAEEISSTQGRKVRRKERDLIKDEVVLSLLPRAFPLETSHFLLIDKTAGLIYCNTSGSKRAEEMLSLIREVLGSLPVQPLRSKLPTQNSMTDWVKTSTAPEDFKVLNDCTLADTLKESGGVIKVKNQDLADQTLLAMLEGGMYVTDLRLAYRDVLSFTLDSDLGVKGIRYEDVFTEKARDDAGEDGEAMFDASLFLMLHTLREMVPLLMTALGGEETPTSI